MSRLLPVVCTVLAEFQYLYMLQAAAMVIPEPSTKPLYISLIALIPLLFRVSALCLLLHAMEMCGSVAFWACCLPFGSAEP